MRSGLPYRATRRWFGRGGLSDLLLQQVVDHRRQLDKACAVLVCIGGAHGYEFQDELVLFEDGSLWHDAWSDVGPCGPPELVCVAYPIDLARELAQLRAELPNRGTVLPEGHDRGRAVSLYVSTRSHEQWVQGTARRIGGPHQGTFDWIVDAVCGRNPNR